MRTKPQWEVEGRGWPNRTVSQFVRAAGFSWHVQIMGQGPSLLLIHGTGAATHSWRGLAPLISAGFRLIALDLPGHGFTEAPPADAYTLPQMAGAIAALLAELKVSPDYVIGHSAGAAIAIRMTLDGAIAPRRILSLNGALRPFPGVAAVAFPALARILFLNPFTTPLLVWRAASPRAVERLIKGTGSTLDAEGLDLYARLLQTERHVGAAIGMMANWDLVPLQRDLPTLVAPLILVAAERDRAVPPAEARAVQRRLPSAKVIPFKGYGHLAHEEAPAGIADIIHRELAS